MTAPCEPQDAAYPRDAMAPHLRTSHAPHRVTVDAELLTTLTERVLVHSGANPGMCRPALSNPIGLRITRATAKLKTRHVPRPAAAAPRAPSSPPRTDGSIPTCTSPAPRPRLGDGPASSPTGACPVTFSRRQSSRVPLFTDRAFVDKTGLHPEHPLLDPPRPGRGGPATSSAHPSSLTTRSTSGRAISSSATTRTTQKPTRSSRRTTNTSSAAASASGDANARRTGDVKPPVTAGGGGSLHFWGWNWLCPRCGRRCQLLYYPLPPINLLRGYGVLVEDDVIDAALAFDPSLRTPLRANGLACDTCHRVTGIGRAQPAAWNDIICYLTGGLLYGREVPKPPWFTQSASIPARPLLRRTLKHSRRSKPSFSAASPKPRSPASWASSTKPSRTTPNASTNSTASATRRNCCGSCTAKRAKRPRRHLLAIRSKCPAAAAGLSE